MTPTARLTDPATSHDAAAMTAPTAATVRARCLLALTAAGEHGLTDFELADAVGRQQTSAGVRRGELMRAGLVVPVIGEDGKPLRRRTPSGASALVWKAA